MLYTMSLLSFAYAAPPSTSGAAPWEELTHAQSWQDVAEGVFPLNPFILKPPSGSGITGTHCIGADMPNWNNAFRQREFVIWNATASQDDAIRKAVWAWNSSDDSQGSPPRTHAGLDLQMDFASGTITAPNVTVEDFAGVDSGSGHPGNGTNDIVLVDDTLFDALANEFDPAFSASTWAGVNAVSLVWLDADPVVNFGLPSSLASFLPTPRCKWPDETDIIIRSTPKVVELGQPFNATLLTGHSSVRYSSGNAREISLPELVIHEIGHTLLMHHPAVKGPNDLHAVMSSIMTPTEPFGGGIHKFDDPFWVSPVGEAGRLLPADYQHQQEHSATVASSRGTLFLTNELTRIGGGTRCQHPNYPEPPAIPTCIGDIGVDYQVTVERAPGCSITGLDSMGNPCNPIVPVFFYNVEIDYKEVWVGNTPTSASNMPSPTGTSAVTGMEGCPGQRMADLKVSAFPNNEDRRIPTPKIVNLGPSDVSADFQYSLRELNPPGGSAVIHALEAGSYDFPAGSMWRPPSNIRIPNSANPGWYELSARLAPTAGDDVPLPSDRYRYEDVLVSSTGFYVHDSADPECN